VLPLIEPPHFPHDKSRKKGCFVDWLPEHRGLRGCRQFLGARSSAFERGAGRVCICPLGSYWDLASLRPRGRDESIKTACGLTLRVSFGECSVNGYSRERCEEGD
jgi:hypothetical protein